MERLVYRELASLVSAYHHCVLTGNDWADKHEGAIQDIVREYMPRGAGVDGGTKIDLNASSGEKLVFTCGFHHMNNGGYYDGWTDHKITLTPSLVFGINLLVSGRNKNDIKDYLADLFHECLISPIIVKD